jgi:hypothetical protein
MGYDEPIESIDPVGNSLSDESPVTWLNDSAVLGEQMHRIDHPKALKSSTLFARQKCEGLGVLVVAQAGSTPDLGDGAARIHDT